MAVSSNAQGVRAAWIGMASLVLVALPACDDEAGGGSSTAGGSGGGLTSGGLTGGGQAGGATSAAGTTAGGATGANAGASAGGDTTGVTAGASGGSTLRDAGSDGGDGSAGDGGDGGEGGATGTTGGSDAAIDPTDEFAEVRQVCVDTINDYRATLGLAPLERATAAQEDCSDQGAKQDGDSGRAHSSAGDGNPCHEGGWGAFPHFGPQNTCPGYPVGGWAGATLADSLKTCLQQMWDEDEPPGGREACIDAYFEGDTACFLAHGHYLNMSGDSTGVACGFYEMPDGRFWMNQDFY